MRYTTIISPFRPCTNALLLLLLVIFSVSSALDNGDAEDWYTKYPAYPPYCSTPDQMAIRKIPDLDLPEDNGNTSGVVIGSSQLVHATVILRHGARTPWGSSLNCWDDYWTNPSTGIWNCNLTAWLSPPPPTRVSEEGDEQAGNDHAMFLFEKHYDAFSNNYPPTSNLSNYLGGTCQKGQLILQGYEQELQNGKFLREAYLKERNDKNHNPRMVLIDVHEDANNGKTAWDNVYYRVDDEARTLMSGQVIFRGLFGKEMDDDVANNKNHDYPVIPLHTADYDRDIMAPNEGVCPRLKEIREAVKRSSEYKSKFIDSREAKLLKEFTHKVLNIHDKSKDMDVIDCLMTTMCTDRPLPDAVNDFIHEQSEIPADEEVEGGYGTHLFQRLVEWDTKKENHVFKANDAEYSKLGMAPLWYEILSKMEPHIKGQQDAPKLAVFSGHDTTIMPLMAALSPNLWPDNEWPPYASMISLELHDVQESTSSVFPSKFAVRIIYNGQVMTEKLEGCPPNMELCDVGVLLDRVKSFAHLEHLDCGLPPEGLLGVFSVRPGAELDYVKTEGKHIVATPEGIVFLILICLICFLLGFLFSCFCCKSCGSQKQSHHYHASQLLAATDEYDNDLALSSNNGGYSDDPEPAGLNTPLS